VNARGMLALALLTLSGSAAVPAIGVSAPRLSGRIIPPREATVNGLVQVCVETQPAHARLRLFFRFTNPTGNSVGQKQEQRIQAGGARCMMYQAPADPQQVSVDVTMVTPAGSHIHLPRQAFPVVPA
jgi:hypothetical protein